MENKIELMNGEANIIKKSNDGKWCVTAPASNGNCGFGSGDSLGYCLWKLEPNGERHLIADFGGDKYRSQEKNSECQNYAEMFFKILSTPWMFAEGIIQLANSEFNHAVNVIETGNPVVRLHGMGHAQCALNILAYLGKRTPEQNQVMANYFENLLKEMGEVKHES